AGDDYLATTKLLLAEAQALGRELAKDSQASAVLEVHAPAGHGDAAGLWGALRSLSQEMSRLETRLRIGDDYRVLEYLDADADVGAEHAWRDGLTALVSGGL